MSHSKVLYVLALSFFLGCAQETSIEKSLETSNRREVVSLDEYRDAIALGRQLIEVDIESYPGLSIAVGVGGQLVWAEGFGWADIEQEVHVDTDSKFRVGSVSKPMTAALLALIYEEGAIDLDAPIQTYVPSFPEKRQPITTRQLAGHTAGIRHYDGGNVYTDSTEFLNADYYETVLDSLEFFKDDPLLFEPGTSYFYSSYGWNLISAVIEGATNADFLAQMTTRVFEPLNMKNTAADQNRHLISHRVRPYFMDENGEFVNAPYADNSYKWAGGGFLSTASDLVSFGFAHLSAGFLTAETITLLHTSQRTLDGIETGYGIGWTISQDEAGRTVVGHGGGSVGGTTQLSMYPEHQVVIAMISNLSDAKGFKTEEIASFFLQ